MKTMTLTNKQFETLNNAMKEAYLEVRNEDERKNVNSLIDAVSQQTAEPMSPLMAKQILERVRADLDKLVQLGADYSIFQSAQATNKYLKKAKKNLEGLS